MNNKEPFGFGWYNRTSLPSTPRVEIMIPKVSSRMNFKDLRHKGLESWKAPPAPYWLKATAAPQSSLLEFSLPSLCLAPHGPHLHQDHHSALSQSPPLFVVHLRQAPHVLLAANKKMVDQQNNPVAQEPIADSVGGHPSQTPINIDDNSSRQSNSGTSNVDVFPGGVQIVKKRRFTSEARSHFTQLTINGVEKAECNYCKKRLSGNMKNGTSHLSAHTKNCAFRTTKDLKQQLLAYNQKKRDANFTVGNYSFDENASRRDLAHMIMLHEYPISMVEHVGFRRFSTGLQPLFKVPSRSTERSDLFKVYDLEKKNCVKILENNSSRIALTSDMWTSSNQKKGYMAITAHFIDDNWEMQSCILRFVYVPCPHTAQVLSEVLIECMLEMNIDRKLSTLTLDNCSTNDAIIEKLLGKLDACSLILDGRIFHMRCCAHILNLIVQRGLSEIEDCIENVRNSVSFWTASPKREQTFREAARQLHITSTKQLVLDCKTRWNSIYLMLTVAIGYKDVFTRLKKKESLYKCLPSESDWDLAKIICEKLEIFHNATEMFSGKKYPTANIFFPIVCGIKISLGEWYESPNAIIKNMASSMTEKFDKYWNVVHDVMSVATVLDPRYKLKLMEYYFPKFYKESASEEISRIRTLCYDLFYEYHSRYMKDKEDHNHGLGESSSSFNKVRDSGKSSWSDPGFEAFISQNEDELGRNELDNYLSEKNLPLMNEFEILAWWKSNGLKYPILQKIARDILAIPISSVASESAFSMGGRVVSKHRSRLHSNTIEALTCGKSWLLNSLQVQDVCSKGPMDASYQTVEYDYDIEGDEATDNHAQSQD
ncbi:zinc finger BED domain-containing protein RICESLEEPER 2-like [Tripterygium wilfordii]|uniref:zinc finger BED domain-containing protein RICESLEEPER 2-like n=1 Tax=Tripterygium wilfordii TaxID=458696 RepID=UPI0018F84373|nr:zinc finger BED domain-containing protein RICESLEEPER 2-like [Tripterygium wilfordii]